MAITYTCDGGCGMTTADPAEFETLGLVAKCHYCPGCAEKARGYLAERDEMHTQAANAFQKARDRLAARHAKASMKLPDQP